jgi:peptidoglycan/LPS O-acetylase OafA/YrhL
VCASLWTLPIELACYCFVAVAGLLVSKKIKSGLILGVLSLAVFYYVFFNGFSALLFYFLFGALLYLFKDKIVLNGVVAVVSFLVLLANLHYNTDPGANFVVKSMNIIIKGASLSYVIMYLSFIKTTHIKNFAKSGDYSYGLYIWAFPLQQIISRSFEGLNAYSLFVLSAIATLFFAALSWHLIEKNALRLKNKLVYKQTQPYANVGV